MVHSISPQAFDFYKDIIWGAYVNKCFQCHPSKNRRHGWASPATFLLYIKKTPAWRSFYETIIRLAALELVELDDKAILWEGYARTNINRINHTDIELVAVVWLDI